MLISGSAMVSLVTNSIYSRASSWAFERTRLVSSIAYTDFIIPIIHMQHSLTHNERVVDLMKNDTSGIYQLLQQLPTTVNCSRCMSEYTYFERVPSIH
jgi:hypothetical protein